MFYAVALSAIAYALLLVRALFGRDRFSPAWISVSVLAWAGCAAAAAGAAVMWANVDTFGLVLEAKTTETLWQSAIVVGVAAVLLLVLAITQRYRRRRGLWAASVCCVALLSVAAPVVLRGPTTVLTPELAPLTRVLDVPIEERSGHVTVIALDAGSLELVTNATSEGRLPNFGRILDAGAVTHLATLHPTSAEAVWAAIATGKLPQKNGVRSAAVYRLPTRPGDTPIQLLPDYCFATGLLRFGVLKEEAAERDSPPGASAVDHPERSRRQHRRREFSTDVPGTASHRLCRQRRVRAVCQRRPTVKSIPRCCLRRRSRRRRRPS